MPGLDLTLDLVFRLLLTRELALLRDMLEAVLDRPIEALTILDLEIPGERPRDKRIVLDIRAVLDDGTRVDVEMQRRVFPALHQRLVYYTARDYAGQLRRGDDYHQLTPTIGIIWLVEPLFPELDRLHSVFELRERHTGARFSDQLEIHVLQLSALSSSKASGARARVERWARFLMAQDDAERERLASEDPIMRIAKDALELLSEDPATHQRAREREDSLRIYEMHLAASRAEGEAEGRVQILLKQLGLRFGALSEEIRARVRTASIDRLDTWAERVLTARTLDEVFEP